MNKDSIAKGLNEPPVPFRLWTTMGRTDIERVKQLSPITVSIEDFVIVCRVIFMRRGNGRTVTGKFRIRREAQILSYIEAAAGVVGDAGHVGGVVEEVEVASERSRREVERGCRRSKSGNGQRRGNWRWRRCRISFREAGVIEAHVVDVVFVAARARIVDVGREKVVAIARKVSEAVEGGMGVDR